MKNMKSLLISFIFSMILFSNIASAQGSGMIRIEPDGLTEEQKAELVLQAAQMRKENVNPSESLIDKINPDELNKWVDLSQNIGIAITATAKELGIASDEFIKTTTGKLIVTLIVWHVMGPDIVGVVGGTFAWFILSSIVISSFIYFHTQRKIVNKKEGTIQYEKRYEFQSGEARAISVAVHVIALIATTLVCGSIIFP